MWQVQISWGLKEDEVLDRFNFMKKGLTGRYGAPIHDEAKYLDSVALWDVGENHYVSLMIGKSTPFRVFVTYYSLTVSNLLNKTVKTTPGSKDF